MVGSYALALLMIIRDSDIGGVAPIKMKHDSKLVVD